MLRRFPLSIIAVVALQTAVIAQPANDSCFGAISVADNGTSAFGNTTSATVGATLPSCSFIVGPSIWYEINPTTNGTLQVVAVADTADVDLALYSSCGGSELICADDGFFAGEPETVFQSVTAGDSVFARVSTVSASPITITATNFPPVTNDTCATAVSLMDDGSAQSFALASATDSGAGGVCGSATGVDAWYSITASETGVLELSVATASDPAIQVLDACGSVMTTCYDTSTGGETERAALQVASGQTLVVRVVDEPTALGSISARLVGDLTSKHVIIAGEDLAGGVDSVGAIEQALVGAGVLPEDVERISPTVAATGLSTLGTPEALWLAAGTFPAEFDPTTVAGFDVQVRDAIVAGVPAFLSGADLFVFSDSGVIREVDGVSDTIFGDTANFDGDDSHVGMTGFDIFAGFDNLYTQDQPGADDFLDRLLAASGPSADTLGPDAAVIWQDDGTGGDPSSYITGVRYTTAPASAGDPQPGRVVSTTSEFGGWFQGDAASLELVMSEMLDYFDSPLSGGPQFIRGDVNEDGGFAISDAITLLNVLFGGTVGPDCGDSADINGDGGIGLPDVIYLLGYLFQGMSAPPAPFPTCGQQPSAVPSVGCGQSSPLCP